MSDRDGGVGIDANLLIETLENLDHKRKQTAPLINMRKEPRLNTQIAAQAVSRQGIKKLVVITDLSASGLRIATFWQIVAELIPDPAAPEPISLQVSYTLPNGAGNFSQVSILGTPVYSRLESEDCYQVGIKVTEFEQGRDELLQFLADRGIATN